VPNKLARRYTNGIFLTETFTLRKRIRTSGFKYLQFVARRRPETAL
jgi:hypothetical protein